MFLNILIIHFSLPLLDHHLCPFNPALPDEPSVHNLLDQCTNCSKALKRNPMCATDAPAFPISVPSATEW
ncbi:Hypothetical protein FKW44_007269 [Caligus rogercresseyi]|uniref:Uncharacterized protein n=1 Tax=Caligus rogercresseyi TaxID=217165 RepID=A0A7T8KEI4_CALRO|nr:Hypothetical protein FKW44_007269 [Caligus rogercresseyi]